jgi:antitoxin component YwqK of YwqJK toxin-antitoxin module
VRAALVLTLATVLPGCSNPVLDYRNIQVVNGKIYLSDANQPFTGTVTNFPDDELLKDQDGFASFANTLAQAAFPDDLRGAQNLGLTAQGMLTAATTAYCDVSVRNGLLDGKAVCKAPRSDTVGTQMSFEGGALSGPMTYYDFALSPNPLSDGSFKGGTPDGTQTIYSPKTGNKIGVATWSDGVFNGKVERYDPTTGALTREGTLKDGKLDGVLVQYSDDGKVKLRSTGYASDLKNGDEEVYYPDGKPKEHSEWADGKLNGVVQRWAEDGSKAQELTYKDGVPVQSDADKLAQALSSPVTPAAPTVDLDACVNAWIAAFHKEQGEDAVVAADQTDEWTQWCQQGKQAPGS